ncbi:MAG TPA: hypothetical protein CFH84_12485 [Sulfurimonas sp. UBA12504]|nr:MAG: hypothetical protein A2019_02425 [Sulfurimonas sp. GWF2_37_8]DAB28895.1 MAG TPA: hypothetical protein CFH84_12485 [Sulfurimonas sp. UBA12504]
MSISQFFSTLFLTVSSTFLGANTLAQVPEASGICFIKEAEELIVVNDEGWIYRLSMKGKILEKKYLGKYDLEGVVYEQTSDTLLLAVENTNSILVVQAKSFAILKEVKIDGFYNGEQLLKGSKKEGIEAIALHEGKIYLSNQSHKKNNSFVFQIDTLQNAEAKIVQIMQHGYVDVAGLCFHNGFLYMTSDEKNLLIKYDLKNNKTIQEIKLPKSAQEGICFDDKNNLYIADDEGKILKYTTKKLGLHE